MLFVVRCYLFVVSLDCCFCALCVFVVYCCLVFVFFGGVVVASWYVPIGVRWLALFVACCLFCVGLLFGVCYLVFVVCWCVGRRMVFGSCCSLLFIMCCVLFVVSLVVGWRLLFVVCC